MESNEKIKVKVQATINVPVEKVWKYWTTPDDIINWNNASPDWHTTHAMNDLRTGGKFSSRMEAKDSSMGFDFSGVYKKVILHKQIDYTLDDDREVSITFSSADGKTEIVETFEAENVYPPEKQREGWQAIIDNFKKYAEKK